MNLYLNININKKLRNLTFQKCIYITQKKKEKRIKQQYNKDLTNFQAIIHIHIHSESIYVFKHFK